MRDPARTAAALERKAADPACTGPERTALREKAAEIRARLPRATPNRPAFSPEFMEPEPATWVETFTTTNGTVGFVTFEMSFGENVPEAERLRWTQRYPNR